MVLTNLRRIMLSCIGLTSIVLFEACQIQPPQNKPIKTDCRPVKHTLGEACVPTTPKRLVVLGTPTMVNAIVLGIKPVGTVLYFEEIPTYLEGKVDGIQEVGTDDQPNLEKILTLNPDLIIAMNSSDLPGQTYQQLSQIAPTVVDDWQGYPSWKDHFNFIATVLDKTDKAQQVWSHYQQRIQDLRSVLGNRYSATKISVIRVCCNNLASDVENSFSGTIIADVGLRRPSSQKSADGGLVFFSEEKIPDLDGDIIFAIVDADIDSQKAFEQLKQKPLWNQLKAVKRGQVYPVYLPTWRGGNPLAADEVINDLFKYLVQTQAS